MKKCKHCGKEYKDYTSHKNHELRCELNPNRESYKCKYCEYETDNSKRIGNHILNCLKNPDYEKNRKSISEKNKISSSNRKHTNETKNKISESRKKYLLENPDKVPYLLNHSRNESYPEKYFTEVFENEGLSVIKSYRIGLYELDFCIPEKKIDIEIDGSQHKYDKKIIESDIRRNKFLEDNGWDIIRVDWSDFQKLNIEEKSHFIKNMISYINKFISEKPTIDVSKKIKKGCDFCKCGKIKDKKSSNCLECYEKVKPRKIKNRPSLEQILTDVKECGYLGTGRKYGVSDNCIRKWIKYYEKINNK